MLGPLALSRYFGVSRLRQIEEKTRHEAIDDDGSDHKSRDGDNAQVGKAPNGLVPHIPGADIMWIIAR